jgi:SAM-dependent methyltransferase
MAATHPDQLRWNERWAAREPDFAPHPLAVAALALPLPAGPVLELACGPSGSALLAAAAGRQVDAVDVSDVALAQLAAEASRRGVRDRLRLVQADLESWSAEPRYAIILCTGYWERSTFASALSALAPGGVLAWEALTTQARVGRPSLPAAWCLEPGQPAALLPASYTVLASGDVPGQPRRRMLARNSAPSPGQAASSE